MFKIRNKPKNQTQSTGDVLERMAIKEFARLFPGRTLTSDPRIYQGIVIGLMRAGAERLGDETPDAYELGGLFKEYYKQLSGVSLSANRVIAERQVKDVFEFARFGMSRDLFLEELNERLSAYKAATSEEFTALQLSVSGEFNLKKTFDALDCIQSLVNITGQFLAREPENFLLDSLREAIAKPLPMLESALSKYVIKKDDDAFPQTISQITKYLCAVEHMGIKTGILRTVTSEKVNDYAAKMNYVNINCLKSFLDPLHPVGVDEIDMSKVETTRNEIHADLLKVEKITGVSPADVSRRAESLYDRVVQRVRKK